MTHSIPEGIQIGMPEQEYRAASGIAQSSLKEMLISPAHYFSRISGVQEPPSEAQIIGTLTHKAVLEDSWPFIGTPEGYDGRSKEGKAWAAAQTLPVVKREIALDIMGMRESVMKHPIAKSILEAKGNNEVSCFKVDEESGLLLKGRADRVTSDENGMTVIADLKTVKRGEGNPESFSKSIFHWHYEFQAHFYTKLLFGASFFVFIVVEKEAPYAVSCYNLSGEAMSYGGRRVRECLEKVKLCMETGEWPAYGNQLTTIGLPEWAMRREV